MFSKVLCLVLYTVLMGFLATILWLVDFWSVGYLKWSMIIIVLQISYTYLCVHYRKLKYRSNNLSTALPTVLFIVLIVTHSSPALLLPILCSFLVVIPTFCIYRYVYLHNT